MKLATIDLKDTNSFSSLFVKYIENDGELDSYISSFPTLDNFKSQIAKRTFDSSKREVLQHVLKTNYSSIDSSEEVDNSIELLAKDNTFTVTTGHQLNIFTGPLYFIYKIATAIKACQQLKEKYPEYNFVPVYWMASEDHDFEEINHFWLSNKKYTWGTDQKGAVGRFQLKELARLAKEVPGMPDVFKEAYSKSDYLAEAVTKYVNELFGSYGLVVVDADNPSLKALFKSVIVDDLLNSTPFKCVEKTSADLNQKGYNTQINAREINFFYLEDGIRERIECDGNNYQVLNSNISFTKEEILKVVDEHPEKFSPNVVLRPLYQETILPNLAYIGGPSEVIYWFQLKGLFENYQTPFPLLMPRNFAAILEGYQIAKIEKTGRSYLDFFRPKNELHKAIALEESEKKVLLNGQRDELLKLFNQIKEQAANIDKTLVAHVEAQSKRTENRLEGIEKKFIRAEKKKHETKLSQVDDALEYFFPGGGLQERRDNFLNFYLTNPGLIDQLIEEFDAFDFKFYILKNGQ